MAHHQTPCQASLARTYQIRAVHVCVKQLVRTATNSTDGIVRCNTHRYIHEHLLPVDSLVVNQIIPERLVIWAHFLAARIHVECVGASVLLGLPSMRHHMCTITEVPHTLFNLYTPMCGNGHIITAEYIIRSHLPSSFVA